MGYIAQIKHVSEQGAAAVTAPEALFLGAPEGSADRARFLFLNAAQDALAPAAEMTFEASAALGWDDTKAIRHGARLAERRD